MYMYLIWIVRFYTIINKISLTMKCCFGGVKLRKNIPILKVYIKYFVNKTKQDYERFI